MENKKAVLIAILSGIILFSLSIMLSWPWLLLFFMAPVFALTQQSNKQFIIGFFSLIFFTNTIALLYFNEAFSIGLVIYPVGLTAAIQLGLFASKTLKGSMRNVGLISFWLGFNYVVLKVIPQWAIYFPFNNLFTDSLFWTSNLGFLGVSFWGIISNSIAKKWLQTPYQFHIGEIVKLVVILIPLMLGWIFNLNYQPVYFQDMMNLYIENKATGIYLERGEWVARTCAWLAVLLTIFSLVKLKTAK